MAQQLSVNVRQPVPESPDRSVESGAIGNCMCRTGLVAPSSLGSRPLSAHKNSRWSSTLDNQRLRIVV